MVLLWEFQFSSVSDHKSPAALKPTQCPLHPSPSPSQWTGLSPQLPQDRLLHPSMVLSSEVIPEHEDAMASSLGAEQLMGARLEGGAGNGNEPMLM